MYRNVYAFTARCSLLLQLSTVYPLILLIIRTQFFGLVFQNAYPSRKAIVLLNSIIMTLTTLFAVYYPNIGDILRFTGAFGGLIMIFILPIAIHMKRSKVRNRLTARSILFHSTLLCIGAALLILQFCTP